jgi:hypothetical protein
MSYRIRAPHHYHVRQLTDDGWAIVVTAGTEASMFRRYAKLFVGGQLPVGVFETIDCHEFACVQGVPN